METQQENTMENFNGKGRVGQNRFGYFAVAGQRNRWAVIDAGGVTHYMHPGSNNLSSASAYAMRLNGAP